MIPDSIVDEVRARVDIVEIVGEQVALRRAGREFMGLCPFHHEKSASFSVVPDKGFYHCFGCDAHGDAFTFLMKRQGLSFQDAVRTIAARVGVEIPKEERGQQEDPHRALYEAIAFAADFYQQQLWEGPTGERARAYLNTRELTREQAQRFGLGYAPAEWRRLREAAQKHGISDDVLLQAGLIKKSEKADEPYDRLRDRLIFPMADLAGRWIAFSGRVIGRAAQGVPKYMNSPETPIYQKGRMFYGLSWAKNSIRREKTALMVEGHMDYVSLAARGIENVVAGSGTALTDEQAQLLARYTHKALLLYDSDSAGLKASFRTGDTLLRAGVEPLIVTLPSGEDPDSLARKGGANALAIHLAKAVDVLDRKLQILDEHGYFRDIEGVRRALDRLLPTIRAAADPALKDIYVDRVAKKTGVRRETIERELTSDQPVPGLTSIKPERVPQKEPRETANRKQPRSREWASERILLLLLLRDPDRIAAAGAILAVDQVRDPVHQEIYAVLLEHGPLPEEPPAAVGLSAEARQRVAEMRADRVDVVEGDRVFDDAIAYIQIGGLELTLDEVRRRMSLASDSEIESLQREELRITTEISQLGAQKARLGDKANRGRRRMRRNGQGGRGGPSTGGNG